MKIDNAIKLFSEKYDREAMQSIERISSEIGLTNNDYSINGFNMNHAFSSFKEYLDGYGKYKEKTIAVQPVMPVDAIRKNVNKFLDEEVIKEENVKYSELPKFITGYIEGIESLSNMVDPLKSRMLTAGVDHESVGLVNEFVDLFMDRLQESFEPVMDKILWASGYNSKKKLYSEATKEKVLFL